MSATPALMLAIMSRWGAMTLRISMSERFMSNSSPNCASVGAFRMSSSSSSMRSSNLDRTGKKLSTSALMTWYTITICGGDAVVEWCNCSRRWRARAIGGQASPRCTVTT